MGHLELPDKPRDEDIRHAIPRGENTPTAWTRRAQEIAEPWAATGWSERSQRIRHERIVQALNPRPGESLLDYGCGTGALAGHVRLPMFNVNYIGFDWSLGMVERARREHPDAAFTTQLRDGETWDLVVCCGTFNLRDNWSRAQTWALVRMLFARTRRAMAVSLYHGRDSACIHYGPSEAATVGQYIAHDFSVERGYLPNDVLLVLRKPSR